MEVIGDAGWLDGGAKSVQVKVTNEVSHQTRLVTETFGCDEATFDGEQMLRGTVEKGYCNCLKR